MTDTTPTVPQDALPEMDAPPAPTEPGAAPAKPAKAPRKRPSGRTRTTRDTAPKPVPARGPGAPSNREKRAKKLADELTQVGVLLMIVHPADGMAVTQHAASIADALAKLADENERVRRLLDGAMTGGAWFGVVVALGGLGLQIAANHGALAGIGEGTPGAPTDASAGAAVFPFPGAFPDAAEGMAAAAAALAGEQPPPSAGG